VTEQRTISAARMVFASWSQTDDAAGPDTGHGTLPRHPRPRTAAGTLVARKRRISPVRRLRKIKATSVVPLQPTGRLLFHVDRMTAICQIRTHHYTQSVPSGKSHYVAVGDALVVWSIPANKNIARFLFGPGKQLRVWELARLWAPNGHDRNLLTRAISRAVGILQTVERPDAVISYADPNAGHEGFVYTAASWTFTGVGGETRAYRPIAGGPLVARRAFHSGSRSMTKAEIEAQGYVEVRVLPKRRFVRCLSNPAKRRLRRFV
jgi:hypothetical protein